MARRAALGLILVSALLIVPAVQAHTTVGTPDGKYFLTVGNANEPVTTYVKTGLELTLTRNETGTRGAQVPGQHLNMTATLISPSGKERSMPLRTQFGSVGVYNFDKPYILTEPGEYFLRVGGNIEGNPVSISKTLVGSGPVPAWEDAVFPAELMTPEQVEARLKQLEAENAALKAQVSSLQSDVSSLKNAPKGNSPAPDLALLGLAAVGLVLVMRRRTK